MKIKILVLCMALIFSSMVTDAKKAFNNMPVTMDEYFKLSAENEAMKDEVVEMQRVIDEKTDYLPEEAYVIRRYNTPPGTPILNLSELKAKRQVQSLAVLSPDYKKIAYTSMYYLPDKQHVSAEAYYIPAQEKKTLQGKLKLANIKDRVNIPLAQTGLQTSYNFSNYTLTILDWSQDSNKLAIIEKISYKDIHPWVTNLIVYDFQTQKSKRLVELREAIAYYWKKKEDISLEDYEWDIKPIGWDVICPDKILVSAYAYTTKLPKFLGIWAIDYQGNHPQLLFTKERNLEISINGYVLRHKID